MERGTTCWEKSHIDVEGLGSPLPLNKAGAPWIVERVEQFVRANPQMNLRLTAPDWFYAQSSRRKHYTFCCYHCGQITAEEIFDQLLQGGECTQDLGYGIRPIASINLKTSVTKEEKPHWCFSPLRRFCC